MQRTEQRSTSADALCGRRDDRFTSRLEVGNTIDMLTRHHNDEGLLPTIILALFTILGGLYLLAALIG